MSYFKELSDYQTYAHGQDDFHFVYNANSGGGQSFLGGKYINEKGELSSPTNLDGCIGVFSILLKKENNTERYIELNDEKGLYEIKPRGEGSSSMKLGIGTKMVSPSKLISAFFMLPPTCTIKSPSNLENSILTANNFWLQSMWLKCNKHSSSDKQVNLVPIDFVYCGGCNKDQQESVRYFELEGQKRVEDLISISEKIDLIPSYLRQYVEVFTNIYLGESPFEYDLCLTATKQIMSLLAKNFPDKYAGIEDPLPFLMALVFPANKLRIVSQTPLKNTPLQQIYYGAPGTGKSHKIKDDKSVKEADKKNMVFRTTFHPDSDYSTYVGAYKPTMKSSERIYSPEELTIKLKEIKTTGTTYPCHKFAAKYWESLKDLTPDSIKQILNACGFTDNYSVEIGKGVAVGQEYLSNPEDGKIIYTFCPQAFTNAYVEAWNTEEKVYLVIEEINRGNCAQIFGDLFQLLDRKNGISEYPVEADTDLQNYLCKALADTKRADIPDDVRSGKKLMLPSNLYIWATMNTSDQSLFPIDSAFKRRWDWKYIKIKEGKDENGNKLDWKVDVKMDESGTLLPWWDFIKKINEIIASMTSSADKQLGYFFCCAKDGVIDEETFVSKVIFYLWNDVFKDYGFEDASLFRYTTKDEDGKDAEKDLTFPDFYDEEGEKVNTERLTDFVKKVMSWKKTNAEQD